MKALCRFLLVLMALALALTAAPAFAQRDRDEGFRGRHEARERHEEHERREHERFEHRGFGYFAPDPFAYYAAPSCYTQDGYWAWNGWQYVWMPPQTVCQ